jgi:type VI protein secretion system component VasK
MIDRLWDMLARRWWTALLAGLGCLAVGASLPFCLPPAASVIKIAVALGVVGFCFLATAGIAAWSRDESSPQSREP